MLCAQFADICQLSKKMVSKYKQMGLIAFIDDAQRHVDARLSLEMMAGRFNEAKRRTALARLGDIEAMEAQATAAIPRPLAGSKPNFTPGQAPEPKQLSSKQEKDYFEARLKELQYLQAAGLLVSVADVAAQAELAISAMRETFSNEKRDAAKTLCALFDIPPDKESAVMRQLTTAFEKALGRFADVARKMAEPAVSVTILPGSASAAADGENLGL
jgi:hypothetical protein